MSFSLLFLAGVDANAQMLEPYIVRNFEKQAYRGENQNWSITQDQNGFIYAANSAGLIEFDGVEWSFYPSPNGTLLRSVAVDRNGRIYTSGYREIGFWERNEQGMLVYQSLNPQAGALFSKNEEFWTTVIIGEQVCFHSFSSVFLYEGGGFRVIRTGELIHSISETGGRLCLSIAGRGLFFAGDTILTPFLTRPEVRDEQVHFCLTLKDSSILIGTASSGLFRLKGNKLTPFLEEWTPYFAENEINRGAIGPNGNIVVGTLLDGILVFDQEGNLLHRINHESGLQNNTVLGIHFDEESNLWLALDRGIDFVSFHTDPSYTLYEYGDIGAVYSAARFQGDLYLCTNQGVYYRDWEKPRESFRFIPGTQGQAWTCAVFNDQLIVGHNTGTYRIEGHVAERISEVSGGFSMIPDPLNKDILIQSTYTNIVFFHNSGAKMAV